MLRKSNHHWFRLSLVAWSAPSHFLKQCSNIVNWTPGTNFNGISIDIGTFSFRKINLKMSSAKLRPFCLGINVLTCALYMNSPKGNSSYCQDKHISWWNKSLTLPRDIFPGSNGPFSWGIASPVIYILYLGKSFTARKRIYYVALI